MSDDLVERLRAAAAYEGARGRIEVAGLLTEAAELIERQRAIVANWEAAWAVQRGSMAERTDDSVPSFVILPAEPNTPR